ncbi:MAG: hypothetical protein Q8Q37_01865 [bacterium]|nr:hypothetical protein [bacterium]
MVIYLYGPDSYRRLEKTKEIVAKYREKHLALGIEKFDFDEDKELDRLSDFIKSQSLFDKFKLAVTNIGNIGDLPTKPLAELLKGLLETRNIIILLSCAKALPKEFKFLLKDSVISQNFEELKGSQLTALIKKEAAKRNLDLSTDDINELATINKGETWGIVNDLEKLALGGNLESGLASPNFFVLINRIRQGDLAALTWLMETDDPAKVFNILSSFMKSSVELKKIADYDVAIKSGKLGYEEALLKLVIG